MVSFLVNSGMQTTIIVVSGFLAIGLLVKNSIDNLKQQNKAHQAILQKIELEKASLKQHENWYHAYISRPPYPASVLITLSYAQMRK